MSPPWLQFISMSGDNPSPKPQETRNPSFWGELKRRKVIRVAIAYAVVSWVITEVSATVLPALLIPEWAISLVVVLLILGFPVALVLAWAFDLTSKGIVATDSDDDDSTTVSGKQRQRKMWMALVAATLIPTLIFGALAFFFYLRSDSDSDSSLSAPSSELTAIDRSIAVLPLTNMSPNQENAFFADGVQEDILTNLSLIKDLRVVSRTSTQKYRTTDLNMKQIGEELGVHYLLEGSVRRAEDQVLVTVQLIDASTDEHIWAENYNRTLDNIFAIQAEIAKTIASKLHAVISPQELERIELDSSAFNLTPGQHAIAVIASLSGDADSALKLEMRVHE